jgi:hypothetical protein
MLREQHICHEIAAPLAIGPQVHADLQNFRLFSPSRRHGAVFRLISAAGKLLIGPSKKTEGGHGRSSRGLDLDGTEGSMNELAKSLSLVKFLEIHKDPADPLHMGKHQTVCVGHQFKDGVTFLCLTTPHFLNNMFRLSSGELRLSEN